MSDDAEYREISMDAPLFAGEIALRDAVLRAPHGRESAASAYERDRTGRHFVALRGGKVAACVGFYPDEADERGLVVRHLAVAADMRRLGLAARLMAFAERLCAESGAALVSGDARRDALAFYEAAGYRAEGPPYLKHDVEHRRVTKALRGGGG